MGSQLPPYGIETSYLDGQVLVAMPGMMDERFARSVIYICAHSAEGAMGIILNRPAANVNMPDLLVQLEIIPEIERIRLPQKVGAMQVLMGGPVETSRGFVLHSPDFHIEQSTLPIDDSVCLTATIDILRAIAAGRGPEECGAGAGLCRLGCGPAGDGTPGQWLAQLPGRCGADLQHLRRSALREALRGIGIEPAMLSMDAGHA